MHNTQPLKLLLIEDSPTDALLFRQLVSEVKDIEVEVQHRDTLRGGITLLESDKVDAVVLDLNLPDSSGLETFDALKSKFDIPIVILSGNDNSELVAQALQSGADNYLLKDSSDGNRIAVSVLSAIRNRSNGISPFMHGT